MRISRRDDVIPKATWTWMEALEDCRNLIFDKPFMKVAEKQLGTIKKTGKSKAEPMGLYVFKAIYYCF